MAAAGDANDLRRLLDLHSERARAQEQSSTAGDVLAAADAEHRASTAALAKAQAALTVAQAVVMAAEAEVEAARTADRAATLRPHLVDGEPCPVCEQTVRDHAGRRPAAAAGRRERGAGEGAVRR